MEKELILARTSTQICWFINRHEKTENFRLFPFLRNPMEVLKTKFTDSKGYKTEERDVCFHACEGSSLHFSTFVNAKKYLKHTY